MQNKTRTQKKKKICKKLSLRLEKCANTSAVHKKLISSSEIK